MVRLPSPPSRVGAGTAVVRALTCDQHGFGPTASASSAAAKDDRAQALGQACGRFSRQLRKPSQRRILRIGLVRYKGPRSTICLYSHVSQCCHFCDAPAESQTPHGPYGIFAADRSWLQGYVLEGERRWRRAPCRSSGSA